MYRKVIGFKLGFFFFFYKHNFGFLHLSTRGICMRILIGLA